MRLHQTMTNCGRSKCSCCGRTRSEQKYLKGLLRPAKSHRSVINKVPEHLSASLRQVSPGVSSLLSHVHSSLTCSCSVWKTLLHQVVRKTQNLCCPQSQKRLLPSDLRLHLNGEKTTPETPSNHPDSDYTEGGQRNEADSSTQHQLVARHAHCSSFQVSGISVTKSERDTFQTQT